MVVVLTTLLALIGVLFVMASRIDEMATSSVVYDKDLDNAVRSVTDLIADRLAEDIPLPGAQYPNLARAAFIDAPQADPWLAPLEPDHRDIGVLGDYGDDLVNWHHVSDITGQITTAINAGLILNHPAAVYIPADANDLMPADADGDGVVDSYWVRLGITTSRGKPVFAAVRILDNCAMLNLNTASYIPDPNTWPDLQGRYLSSVDYHRFLRGNDRLNPMLIQLARQGGALPIRPPAVFHHDAIMHIELPAADLDLDGDNNPVPDYSYRYFLFDIADELEIRNRYMLTSAFEAMFERKDVSNFTFDAGGGPYGILNVPVQPGIAGYFGPGTTNPYTHFAKWTWRIDPNNFDDQSGAFFDAVRDYRWMYDRRHVCTFYNFTRDLRLHPLHPLDGRPVPLTIFKDEADPLTASTNFGLWNPLMQKYDYNRDTHPDPEVRAYTRTHILKLLYAARAYFLTLYPGEDYTKAARRACQFVANMIDYVDDTNPATPGPFFGAAYGSQTNDNPTFINRAIIRQLILEVSDSFTPLPLGDGIDIGPAFNPANPYEFGIGSKDVRETVYGYERQPFISKIARLDLPLSGTTYAIELCNPYNLDIPLEGWRIKVGGYTHVFTAAEGQVVPAAALSPARLLGRLVLASNINIFAGGFVLQGFVGINPNDIIELQRPDPSDPTGTQFVAVDRTLNTQSAYVAGAITPGFRWRVSKRDDTKWRLANQRLSQEKETNLASDVALGTENGIDLGGRGYQLPVPNDNDPIDTLHDFEIVLLVGNERDPNGTTMTPITERVAYAAAPLMSRGEKDVRPNVYPTTILLPNGEPSTVSPLDFMSFMGRPEGSLPGRININTAPMEVIRAAIRDRADLDNNSMIDNEALARAVVQYRRNGRLTVPYFRITDLLDVGFRQFANDPNDNVGDPEMTADFEERDWILSQVANLFTVRSDTFTAYILVRAGHDGPERRMVAVFNRSNIHRDLASGRPSAKPQLVALHPVPDPR